MTNKDALIQGERTVGDRLKHKPDTRTTDEKLFDELSILIYRLGDLVVESHAEVNRILIEERGEIRNIKVALEGYRKAIKK